MVIYSYFVEKKEKERSPKVRIVKKEKSTSTLGCISHALDSGLGRDILNVKDKKNNMVSYGTNLKTLTSLPNWFNHSTN